VVKALHPLEALTSYIHIAPESRIQLRRAVSSLPGSLAPANHILDIRKAAADALAAPLNFPPLARATVPGDHLAIAVDDAVPVEVVLGVLDAAVAAGVELQNISIASDRAEWAAAFRATLGESNDGVQVVLHDPDDRQGLCFVGRTESGEQLLINRTIFEADVVLPVGCARVPNSAGGGSLFDSLFPRFCDAETIGRLRTPARRESFARQAEIQRQTMEAGWLVGVPLVIQIVPAGNGQVADVIAGEPEAVAARCDELSKQLWSFHAPRRASLVIASITGPEREQTWENVARALATVEGLVEEHGAIAICSDVQVDVGPALGRLVGNSDWERMERDARNDHSEDSWPAWHLARALQRGPVYFLSRLDDELVEEIGMAPVGDFEELERLANRHESCILLDDAQHACATVVGEP
jgi:nickel-dependent lactate racemase